MKNKIYISLLVGLLGLSSCGEEFLNVEPTSVASENKEDQISEGLLAGTYAYMYKYNTQGSSASQHRDFGLMGLFHLCDVKTDDLALDSEGSGWFSSDSKFLYRTEEYNRTFMYWNFFYTLISKSNEIIKRIPSNSIDKEQLGVKGQALALRGMSYYYLINMYQQTYSSLQDPAATLGVPIMISAAEGESIKKRASVKEVYDRIEKDYKDAIGLLDGYNRSGKNRIDKPVAQILLSRAYLTMERWADAASMAHDARVNSSSKLMDVDQVSKDGYNNIENDEWMWGADITNETSTTFASFFSFLGTFDDGYGGAVGQYRKIDANLYKKFSATDKRLLLFKSPDAKVDAKSDKVEDVVPAYTNFKFKKMPGWTGDYVFMRLSEAYLTEAEALAHLGKNTEAASVLKIWMLTRDPKWDKTSVTVDEVYTQRRLEFWGEGFAFFDHLRLKKDVIRDYVGTNHWAVMDVKAGDWKMLYQIPRRELQDNPLITPADQNP